MTHFERRLTEDTGDSFRDALATESIREFYQKNPWAKWAVVGITVIGSLVGFVLSGWPGVLGGFILAAVSYALGPLAVTKVRVITRTRAD